MGNRLEREFIGIPNAISGISLSFPVWWSGQRVFKAENLILWKFQIILKYVGNWEGKSLQRKINARNESA